MRRAVPVPKGVRADYVCGSGGFLSGETFKDAYEGLGGGILG